MPTIFAALFLFLSSTPADAVTHSIAENAFWSEIMTDHAAFFTMLMPGSELAGERARAEEFQRTFQTRLDEVKAAKLNAGSYAAFNRSTIALLKPFITYQRGLLAAQRAGLIQTLAWPSFFENTARQAERAVARLERLSTGDTALAYEDVVEFWSGVVSDHAGFIAHMIDPKEQDLATRALDSSAVFEGLRLAMREKNLRQVELLVATEEFIDLTGEVRTMIMQRFADHFRRGALRFLEEIRRTSNRT